MIFEGVITTLQSDGSAHITPLGFRELGADLEIAPFIPSTTLDNLRRHPYAVMNLTDDVRIIAGCLTGRREWPVVRAIHVDGWRLAGSLAHLELETLPMDEDTTRPRFRCKVRHAANHAPFKGFNRAQAAVVEAAILVSRLDWLAPDKLAGEMAYLKIAVDKTAGAAEREAWRWLLDAIVAHPRHRLTLDTSS